MSYYIKRIYGPHGQRGYPKDNLLEFSERSGKEKIHEDFKNECEGFLLYETKVGENQENNVGAGAIYAYGEVDPNQSGITFQKGKKFPYAIRVNFKKKIRLKQKGGVPYSRIKKVISDLEDLDYFIFHRATGGLRLISKDVYNILCEDLNYLEKIKILIIGLDKGTIKQAFLSEMAMYNIIEEKIKVVEYNKTVGLNFKSFLQYDGLLIGPHPHKSNILTYLKQNHRKNPFFEEVTNSRGELKISVSALKKSWTNLRRKIWESKKSDNRYINGRLASFVV